MSGAYECNIHLFLLGNSLYLVDFEKKYIDKAMEAREKRLKSGTQSSSIHSSADNDEDDAEIIGDVPDDTDVPDEEMWLVLELSIVGLSRLSIYFFIIENN